MHLPDDEENPETVNISASVTNGTDPLSQVTIVLTNTETESTFTKTTGSQGGCSFNNIPLGTYTVSASKEGYDSYSGSLTVTSETDSLEITLTKQ